MVTTRKGGAPPSADPTEEPALGSHRQWALPILRALDDLGGSGSPTAVEGRVRAQLKDQLNDLQWARVLRGNYIRWARHTLKKVGLVAGEKGTWQLTPAGLEWLAARRDEPISTTWDVVELPAEEAGDLAAALETVEVTDFDAYEVPILRLLRDGPMDKRDLVDKLGQALASKLLPGDSRFMPRGRTVFRYRASWTLTNLKKTGAIRNPSVARWELTESGRSRLDREEKTWSIEPFRGSKAKVRGGSTVPTVTAAGPASVGPAWPTPAWRLFAADFPDLATTVEGRVRPDLAPTPQRAIARNVVFYGPPGTGKTYIAKKVAVALTGEDEPGPESSWRLVQFHPSYAYEDFVQGLRPALEATDLQYKLHQGPFLQVCKAAEDDPDRFHVLIIDEINRGDPARIFGELLYALEYRDESIELAGGGSLVVPSNLVIVGTMNSVDRSVALVDHALRRRFAFVRVDPNPEAITTSPRLGAMLASFNAWLVAQLDPEHAVGHSVFLNPALAELSSDETIARVWRHDVRPLLEEYFFGQPEQLRAAALAWRKAQEETEDEDEAEDAGNTPS